MGYYGVEKGPGCSTTTKLDRLTRWCLLVARLIQSGVALNHANNMGANALHAACLNGHFECAPPPAPEPNQGPMLSPNSTRAPALVLAMALTLTLPLTRCASLLIEAGALVNEVAQS